jgi:methionyl-tRNA formyltransferase
MSLTKEMDAGAVYAYSEIDLEQQETKQQLADDLLELGSEMLLSILPRIASGAIAGSPQNDSRATYDSMIVKQDGVLDLSKPAEQLEREVRAYLGWPGSHMVIAGKDVVVTRVHMANNALANVDKKTIFVANKQLCLQTADGVLVIDSLKPAGKSDMPALAFLAGYGRLL